MRVIANRYRLVRRLGQGGMGSVWLAERTDIGQTVAVKILQSSLARDRLVRERFEREARALASIDSRFVVRFLDYGIDADVPFQVMAVLVGEDLAVRLKRDRYIKPDALGPIVDQVAKGLARAHALGLVHRDLKPANIFLAKEDGEEVAKVIDFGIAKTLDQKAEALTETGEVVGTPAFMSPEQIRGPGQIDARSDVWSLGATIYCALTGRKPFEGANSGDLMVRVCTDPIRSAREHMPALPPEVDEFFARALCRDIDRRYASVIELADGFQAVVRAAASMPTGEFDLPPSSALRGLSPATPSSPSHTSAPTSRGGRTPSDVVPASGRTPSAQSARSIGDRIPMVQSVAPAPIMEAPARNPLLTYLLYGLIAVGIGVLAFFAIRNRRASSTDLGPARLELRPAVADCIDPDKPNPDSCERECGSGAMTIDDQFEQTTRPRHGFLKFDLPERPKGRTLEKATLVLTVPVVGRGDGPHGGELWEVTPFDRPTLYQKPPAQVGGFPLVQDPGPAKKGETVSFSIPVRAIKMPGSLHLGLYPIVQDGVDYYNARGSFPPSLVLEFR